MRQKLAVVIWIGLALLLFGGGCKLTNRLFGPNKNAPTIPDTGGKRLLVSPPSPAEACRASGVSASALALGGRLYVAECAGCHGRQGQGYAGPDASFPALVDSPLALSDHIQPQVDVMMNTDIHPMATGIFEADALKMINYIRVDLAKNPAVICPGDVTVRVNP